MFEDMCLKMKMEGMIMQELNHNIQKCIGKSLETVIYEV